MFSRRWSSGGRNDFSWTKPTAPPFGGCRTTSGCSSLAQDQSFVLPLTQEQLADATGLTSVHTNRVLQALRREGLISLSTDR